MDHSIQGESAGAPDDDGQDNRENQQVVLVSLTLLVSKPVREKSEVPVNHRNGDKHVYANAQRGDAAQESENQAQPAEELRANRQEGQRGRDAQRLGEKAHGAAKAIATEPAQHLLRPVSEENDSQYNPYYGQYPIRVGLE
jgi:hypothetical protein